MGRVVAYFKKIPSRTVEYFKLLGQDYKTAFIDVCKDAKEKPLKAGLITAILGGLTYAYKTNPSERDLLNGLVEKRLLLATLPNTIHNPVSDESLNLRTDFGNQNRLRYIDCFFFSLLVGNPYDEKVCIYESQDANLRDWWFKEIKKNFIDIGAFNTWHRLKDSFINYDVNEKDLEGLPEVINNV